MSDLRNQKITQIILKVIRAQSERQYLIQQARGLGMLRQCKLARQSTLNF